MKKLALVLTLVFGIATIAPAFAADPVKKETKTECTKDAKCCSKDCTKACCKKDGKANDNKDAKVEVKK